MLNNDQQIFEQIKKANDILITFRKLWNGDAVASALAMYLLLKKMNKKVDIVAEKFNDANSFSFLPAHHEIKYQVENLYKFIISLDISKVKLNQIKYKIEDNNLNFIVSVKEGGLSSTNIKTKSSEFRYDLIIVVDSPDLESLGSIYEANADLFYKKPIINIDHHPSNEEFGHINNVEITSVATAEIIFKLFYNNSPELIDENIATCLLAGMISKTKSFKTSNITPEALSIAAQLISLGARREEIINHFYRSHPINTLKLWGRTLARLESALEGKLAWTTLSHIDFVKTGSDESKLNEVIDELIVNMPEVKVIIIFYEKIINGEVVTNALISTFKNINSFDLLQEFNPQGAKNIAKISLKKPIQEAQKEIVAITEERMKKMSFE